MYVVRLPDQYYDDLYPTYQHIDWAPGERPGPAFPAGTVYVITREPTPDDPVSVTEWDLARSAIVRSLRLPTPTDEGHPWILRVGDQLRVLVQSSVSLSFVQLTTDLRVESIAHWADHVALPYAGVFSADAQLTVVAYPGDFSGDKGQRMTFTTFDAAGKRKGTRIVWGGATPSENAVVLGGRVFLVLADYKAGVELSALSPSLALEKRVIVSPEWSGNLAIEPRDGHLQVITGYPTQHAVEFTTSLERLGPATPIRIPPFFELGAVKVHLCGGHQGRTWLAWSTTIEDACPASPAELWVNTPDDP